MNKKDAIHIMIESYKAYELLLNLVPDYIPLVENYKDANDLNARIYRGVFQSTHDIMNMIHNEIFNDYPDIKEEFIAIMNEKYANK